MNLFPWMIKEKKMQIFIIDTFSTSNATKETCDLWATENVKRYGNGLQITAKNAAYKNKLTVLVRDDNDRLTDVSISFDSGSKDRDAVVGVFLESCQCYLLCWSIHHLSFWSATRKRFVGNCVSQNDAILITLGNIVPLN